MKKLEGSYLSIGAGENQLPLISAAKSRGLKVISVDQNPKAPGFAISDIKILESTHEYRKILHAMSQVPLSGKLMGIGTRSFGKACYTVSYLNSKFRLKGNLPEVVNQFLDKQKLKSLSSSIGLPTPKTVSDHPSKKNAPEIHFPIIAKPKAGSGKAGILILENETEFKKLSKQKKSNDLVFEEFVPGDEVTVLGFVIGKKFYILSITDKITTGIPQFIEIAHIAPSKHLSMAGELRMMCQVLVNKSGLKSGPFVAEFKINSKSEAFLIEAAPEVGGEYLADVLLPNHFGYNYFSDYLSVTIGEKTRPKFLTQGDSLKKYSALVFYLPKANLKKSPPVPNFILNLGETKFFEKVLIPPGERLDSLEGNHKRTYVIGVSTRNEVDANLWVQSIMDRLHS